MVSLLVKENGGVPPFLHKLIFQSRGSDTTEFKRTAAPPANTIYNSPDPLLDKTSLVRREERTKWNKENN